MKNQKPKIEFQSAHASGNIFAILGKFSTEMRRQHRITEYNETWERVQNATSYEEALAIIREKAELVDLDGRY